MRRNRLVNFPPRGAIFNAAPDDVDQQIIASHEVYQKDPLVSLDRTEPVSGLAPPPKTCRQCRVNWWGGAIWGSFMTILTFAFLWCASGILRGAP